MRRVYETGFIIDLFSVVYRQQSWTVKYQISGGYCWPTYIKVLGVLCLGEVSSTFLPSKKACWAHQFQYLGVGQQYPVVCEPQRRALNFPQSWLRVFQRGNAAHLPHGVGQER